MRVLVTGATSMIGAAVVERLEARGDTVSVLQRRSGGRGHEVLGDITDPAAAAAAVDGQEAVVHLAAKVGVTGAWEEYRRVNVAGTETVITAARTAGVTRFVYVSSPSVAHGGQPLIGVGAGPADPDATRGHYSTSKAIAERYALSQAGGDFAVVAIRPHLVWGPGDIQLVGRIVDRARQGRLATIGTGAALIDTTYVDNAADALVAAIDQAPGVSGEALVVSNGEPRPVGELIERIVGAAGVAMPGRRVPSRLAFAAGLFIEKVWEWTSRQDDPPMTSFLAEQLSTAHWFDQRRTTEALDWRPAVTLDEGFARLGRWFAGERSPEPGPEAGMTGTTRV